MNEPDDDARYLPGLFLGALALAILLRWASDLTSGDEYGGRFDLPVINSITWFGFCLAAVAAVLLFLLVVAHVVAMFLRRDDKPAARD